MTPLNTENKLEWCALGEELENKFVKQVDVVGWDVSINPEKSENKYVHDMVATIPVDLKSMPTPWKLSQSMFGIPPEYAISINKKDIDRYARLYPNIIILCDVLWTGKIYSLTIPRALRLIRAGKVGYHQYKKRINDTDGNAKDSYIFDLRHLDELVSE